MAAAVLESSSSDGWSSSSLPVFFFNFGFQQLNGKPGLSKNRPCPRVPVK
jgi:hypothetical protein